MIDLTVLAIRKNSKIEITLLGSLPDTCHRAVVKDVYPGGDIVYTHDPGAAQVFIEEWVAVSGSMCALVLIPWGATLEIEDGNHNMLDVFINDEKVKSVEVSSIDQFLVYELTGGIVPSDGKCSILSASVHLPSPPYTKHFGPDNYKACLEWIMRNGKKLGDQQNLDGGGSGSPRGIKKVY
jgi:hypothetical protein